MGFMQSAYIETSVVSYLTGRRSRDALAAAHQQVNVTGGNGEDMYSSCMFRNLFTMRWRQAIRTLLAHAWRRSTA